MWVPAVCTAWCSPLKAKVKCTIHPSPELLSNFIEDVSLTHAKQWASNLIAGINKHWKEHVEVKSVMWASGLGEAWQEESLTRSRGLLWCLGGRWRPSRQMQQHSKRNNISEVCVTMWNMSTSSVHSWHRGYFLTQVLREWRRGWS